MSMTLRVIWRYTRMSVMETIEYRAAFLILMINIVMTPLISLLVWLTLSEQGVALPYDRSQLVTYYLLLSLVSMLTSTWLGEYLAHNIREGQVSPLLLRPSHPITNYIGNNLGEKIVKLPLLLLVVGLVAIFFRHDLRLPDDPQAWLLFLLCLPLAASVAFLLDVVIALLAFWLDDVWGLLRIKALAGAFLAGQYIPLALFPPDARQFVEVQPFRYTLSFPLEVLTGRLSRPQLWYGLGWQIGYVVLLWTLYRLLWRVGLRSYSATGA